MATVSDSHTELTGMLTVARPFWTYTRFLHTKRRLTVTTHAFSSLR